ncbi:MAG: hydrogenase expression/formation protein [Burkholderiales bacterium]|nr:hydrogenase expression/formation protein [Burkholderiales bacterium]
MKPFPLPVRVAGPGSHVEDEELQYLAMPRGMAVFEMPRIPPRVDAGHMAAARELLAGFLERMGEGDAAKGGKAPRLDLDRVDPGPLDIANQMLGEGEVAIRVDGARPYRIQESVFAGVWRVCELDADGRVARDWIESSPIPAVVIDAAAAGSNVALPSVALPDGAMNSPALLTEIQEHIRTWRPGGEAHVINLTLFPMSPEDHQVMERAVPVGPVAIMSRGFGNCRVTSTGARNVWRVQYFNNMNTLILNTIEVVDLPEVAVAAAEDLADSRERFAELVDWMGESAEA